MQQFHLHQCLAGVLAELRCPVLTEGLLISVDRNGGCGEAPRRASSGVSTWSPAVHSGAKGICRGNQMSSVAPALPASNNTEPAPTPASYLEDTHQEGWSRGSTYWRLQAQSMSGPNPQAAAEVVLALDSRKVEAPRGSPAASRISSGCQTSLQWPTLHASHTPTPATSLLGRVAETRLTCTLWVQAGLTQE